MIKKSLTKAMKNLKSIRNDAGFTQSDMAKMLNVSQQCYSDYERGKTNPDLETLVQLTKILGVSSDYLLGITDDFGQLTTRAPGDFYTSPTEQELILNFRRIQPDLKNHILGIVRNLASNSDHERTSCNFESKNFVKN